MFCFGQFLAQASLKSSAEHYAALTIQTPFKGHRLETLPSQNVKVSRAEMLKLFEEMWRVRRMEMAADSLYKAKLIRGFCHLGIGQVHTHTKIVLN